MLSEEQKAKLPYVVFRRYDNGSFAMRFVNSDAKCNIVGGFDIRLLSYKKTMLPCQDILTSPVPKGTRLPI